MRKRCVLVLSLIAFTIKSYAAEEGGLPLASADASPKSLVLSKNSGEELVVDTVLSPVKDPATHVVDGDKKESHATGDDLSTPQVKAVMETRDP